MASERERGDGPAPPASEHVHLPGPSYLPVLLAFGITVALIGVILSWIVFALGLVIFLVVLVRWVRETRQSMAELPLEH